MNICSFCAFEYDELTSAQECGKCALFGGCRMVKCPRCGYESPQIPRLLKALQNWGAMRRTNSRK